ncbi:MAG: NAD(P)-dependent oxidoreductase [Candidatus Paceibacterota bacterium]
MKIVVTNNQNFTKEQTERLSKLGEVTYYDELPKNGEEYLERVEGADIICSGTAGLKDAYDKLKNVYITVGFVSVAFVDLEVMKKNNALISNAPGINKNAVSEWIMWMAGCTQRNFNEYLNTNKIIRINGSLPPMTPGLVDKNITILGYGNVGKQTAKLAEAYGMNVSFFKKGDDLHKSVKNADIVVDTLSSNPTTYKILNKDFFNSMKDGSSFISVTRSENLDEDALIEALNTGKLNKACLDCGGALVGDTEDSYYQKLLTHPKILVTPHIAYSSEKSFEMGNNVMVENVEAYIKGKPQNVLNA